MSLETPVLLPSSVAAEPIDKVTCRICRRQFSKYTCPTCNLPYCSLTCFRSEAHEQCSETFYKKEVESDIRSEPSKTAQERLRMMNLLRKFEEENADDNVEQLGSEDEGDDEGDFVKRFRSIDLQSTSSDTLWSMLTSEERAKFLSTVDDPTSELAQQLLASEELEKERRRPWWTDATVDGDDPLPGNGEAKPALMKVPSSMVKPISNGPSLVYNVCAICIAYAYTIRHLALSSFSTLTLDNIDFQESRRLVTQLVPFLKDRKSTALYPNLSSITTDIWSRLDNVTPELFSLLLSDASALVRPSSVTPIDIQPTAVNTATADFDIASHPHKSLILVLSDLAKLFQSLHPSNDSVSHNPKPNQIIHKLLFYAAHILSTPSLLLRAVAQELADRSITVKQQSVNDLPAPGRMHVDERRAAEPEPKVKIIEDL